MGWMSEIKVKTSHVQGSALPAVPSLQPPEWFLLIDVDGFDSPQKLVGCGDSEFHGHIHCERPLAVSRGGDVASGLISVRRTPCVPR